MVTQLVNKFVSEEQELLTILAEEAAEVAIECSKLIRFGGSGNQLSKEIGDLWAMVELAHKRDLISMNIIDEQIPHKWQKLKVYSNLTID